MGPENMTQVVQLAVNLDPNTCVVLVVTQDPNDPEFFTCEHAGAFDGNTQIAIMGAIMDEKRAQEHHNIDEYLPVVNFRPEERN